MTTTLLGFNFGMLGNQNELLIVGCIYVGVACNGFGFDGDGGGGAAGNATDDRRRR